MRSPWHRGPGDICPWWLCRTFDNPIRRLFHKPERMLASFLKPGMRALDVGCGMGYFSIPMASLVGESGQIVAVDLQEGMLDTLKVRAERAGVLETITPVLCTQESLSVEGPVDFALAFWMVHETPDRARFLSELYSALGPGGRLLITEPLVHVGKADFMLTLRAAEEAGFRKDNTPMPRISFSRSALLIKD